MSTVGSYRGPNIVTRGLVLHLDAASPNSYYAPNGGTVWKDVSGNINNSTLLNEPLYEPDNSGRFYFDGTNDKVQTPIEYNTWHEHSWTVQSWFSYNSVSRNNGFFEMTRQNSSGNWGVSTVPRNNELYFYWVGTSGAGHSFTSTEITSGNIINVTIAYRAVPGTPTQSELYDATDTYINGQPITHESNGGAGISSDGRLYVGSPTYHIQGDIYSFLYYEKALSAQEVLQNYNATKDRFGL